MCREKRTSNTNPGHKSAVSRKFVFQLTPLSAEEGKDRNCYCSNLLSPITATLYPGPNYILVGRLKCPMQRLNVFFYGLLISTFNTPTNRNDNSRDAYFYTFWRTRIRQGFPEGPITRRHRSLRPLDWRGTENQSRLELKVQKRNIKAVTVTDSEPHKIL